MTLTLFPPDRATSLPWSKRSWTILILLLAVYVTLVGHRPIPTQPGAIEDDQLFIRLALELASGRWLGPYDHLTLVKGIGFPAFLSLNYLLGLPVNLSLCIGYGLACAYLASVLKPLVRSQIGALILFALLLFLPPLAAPAAARIDRDFFCTALTVALVAGAINLAMTHVWPRWRPGAVLLVGGFGAWFWMTREEGVWLLPTLALITLLGWRLAGFSARWLLEPGLAVVVALLMICGVGLTNRLIYGRFVITEMNSAPFQSAMVALERASYPEWTAYVPVPLAARQKIYAQSATFARLKPYLDPPGGRTVWTGAGCDDLPTSCDDIAGGWFVWALRDAAAQIGVMSNPRSAATFFSAIETEVADACREKRLECARWLPPLVPPFTRDQVRKFPRHLRAALSMATLADEVNPSYAPIDSLSRLELQGSELLAVPEHGPGQMIVVRGHAEVTGTEPPFWRAGSTQILHTDWNVGLPVADPSKPRTATFELTLACLFEPCVLGVGNSTDTAVVVPVQELRGHPVAVDGRGSVIFETVNVTPRTLRSQAGAAFMNALPTLNVGYHDIVLLGSLSLLASVVASIVRRKASTLLLLIVSLMVGAAARAFLLALVDATSFQAVDYGYMLPLLPLSLAAAYLSTAECLMMGMSWTKRRRLRRDMAAYSHR